MGKKKKKGVGELTSRKTSACCASGEDDVLRYTPYVVYLPSFHVKPKSDKSTKKRKKRIMQN